MSYVHNICVSYSITPLVIPPFSHIIEDVFFVYV